MTPDQIAQNQAGIEKWAGHLASIKNEAQQLQAEGKFDRLANLISAPCAWREEVADRKRLVSLDNFIRAGYRFGVCLPQTELLCAKAEVNAEHLALATKWL